MGKSGFFDFHEQVMRQRKGDGASGALAPQGEPNAQSPGRPAPDPITVSQLTSRVERVLKAGVPETLYVRGEVSNFRPNQSSGHVYFTLKDPASCVDCVMWRSDAVRLKFTPTDGMELLATGRVGVFVPRGKYQFYVTTLRPLGQGALEIAFQQLRAKLEAEGLFEAGRKRPLPMFPMSVVLITGADTAALADMLKVLGRYPWLRLMVYAVPVQGDGAAAKIAAAIAHVSRDGEDVGVEVIILARGGGSLEDLWSFNEEIVARAIAASTIPVVTGIGHEVDTSIADLVADYHAHTPTEAAQVVAAQWRTAREAVDGVGVRLRRAIAARVQEARHRLRAAERHEAFRRPQDRINSYRQLLDDRQRALLMAIEGRLHTAQLRLHTQQTRLDRHIPATVSRLRERMNFLQQSLSLAMTRRIRIDSDTVARLSALLTDCHPKYRLPLRAQKLTSLAARFDLAIRATVSRSGDRLTALGRQLEALAPENVLRRGYTITTRKKGGAPIRSSAEIKPGDRLITRFADGQVESVTEDSRQPPLFE
ncbi:MAG: exodeoxyribonuclease large subunit [Phycisphaerales bacterium]|nr:exodeoxyribonuclease large subunit [Phycisphaerales bacterium]MDB5357345.1 exodeoxyribonuclease large subunit [Phycisphaerales bacterium]